MDCVSSKMFNLFPDQRLTLLLLLLHFSAVETWFNDEMHSLTNFFVYP